MRSSELLDLLLEAPSLEQAAFLTLDAMLQRAGAALADSPLARRGKILRAMLHLRPREGYRGLMVLEAGSTAVTSPGADAALLPSASSWRLVAEHRRACAVDVTLRQATLLGEKAATLVFGQPEEENNQDTILRLRARDATHMLTLPLRAPGREVQGMISLEASCLSASGRPFVWASCAAELQHLADLATPTLMAHQPSPVASPPVRDPLLPVVGERMRALIGLLGVFATLDETLLISGPTGAGKSRLAAWFHARSPRAGGPFQMVDLLTVPEDMQMAELFGWKKGAFTGALKDQAGCVARAAGGTLFIDEIDKLSLKAQAGLLQLLETRRYRVLGDPGGAVSANARFVVGTNADLAAEVAAGRFREDLYYRVNVLPVRLPGLDERADELPGWATFMAERRHGEAGGAGGAELTEDALALLATRRWPGNLRQLDNVIRRAYAIAIASEGRIPPRLVLGAPALARALAFESQGEEEGLSGVVGHMRRAARAFVRAALGDGDGPATLDVDHTRALRGLVFAEALAHEGDLKKVYLRFGQHKLVEGRNHTGSYKRDLEKVLELCEATGEAHDPDWLAWVRGDRT